MSRYADALRAADARKRTEPGATASRTRFEAEMRALRVHLTPLLDERRPAVIGVTSCSAGEGVTTVARELSRVLAGDGFDVLLCGPHGRGPAPAAAERRIVKTVVPGLSFVDVGDLCRPDADRRGLVHLRNWLQTAKDAFDVVILDTPPILNQGGWEALFKIEDGVLLVIEAERTRSAVAQATVDALKAAGGHILGIVFNRRRHLIPEVVYRWL